MLIQYNRSRFLYKYLVIIVMILNIDVIISKSYKSGESNNGMYIS